MDFMDYAAMGALFCNLIAFFTYSMETWHAYHQFVIWIIGRVSVLLD